MLKFIHPDFCYPNLKRIKQKYECLGVIYVFLGEKKRMVTKDGNELLITHPFILGPQFLQFLEIWFEKSGSRNLVQEKWFCKLGFFFWFEKSGWPEKQVGLYYKSTFFQVGEKWFCKLGFFFWFEKSGWPEKKSEIAEPLF